MKRWLLGKVGLGASYDCVILEARREWLEEAGRTLSKDDVVVDSTFRFDDWLPKALEKMVEGQGYGKAGWHFGLGSIPKLLSYCWNRFKTSRHSCLDICLHIITYLAGCSSIVLVPSLGRPRT